MTNAVRSTIRVLIVDDHPSVRRGLAFMIRAASDLEYAGECANGNEAIQLAKSLEPDVVLMDLALPEMDGIQATRAIRAAQPSVKVLMLTSFVDPDKIQGALAAGAIGYLLKTADDEEVVRAIRAAAIGKRTLAPEAAEVLLTSVQAQSAGASLTEREREVLTLMSQGLNNQEIAAKLFIALPTVKFHITNILSKLGVDNRTEAVLLAIRQKLVKE